MDNRNVNKDVRSMEQVSTTELPEVVADKIEAWVKKLPWWLRMVVGRLVDELNNLVDDLRERGV